MEEGKAEYEALVDQTNALQQEIMGTQLPQVTAQCVYVRVEVVWGSRARTGCGVEATLLPLASWVCMWEMGVALQTCSLQGFAESLQQE